LDRFYLSIQRSDGSKRADRHFSDPPAILASPITEIYLSSLASTRDYSVDSPLRLVERFSEWLAFPCDFYSWRSPVVDQQILVSGSIAVDYSSSFASESPSPGARNDRL